MWADTGQDILAVIGRTLRLGLKTSEEIGGLLASFVGLCRTATMKMTGADERDLEDVKRRVVIVERRLIILAAFTVSTFGLWLALIIYQVFL
jgi:hypothetical protein